MCPTSWGSQVGQNGRAGAVHAGFLSSDLPDISDKPGGVVQEGMGGTGRVLVAVFAWHTGQASLVEPGGTRVLQGYMAQ